MKTNRDLNLEAKNPQPPIPFYKIPFNKKYNTTKNQIYYHDLVWKTPSSIDYTIKKLTGPWHFEPRLDTKHKRSIRRYNSSHKKVRGKTLAAPTKRQHFFLTKRLTSTSNNTETTSLAPSVTIAFTSNLNCIFKH
jgi:hypothetical protein